MTTKSKISESEVIAFSPEETATFYLKQDTKFCDAMQVAVVKKTEHPPMVGIDTRPGTRNPLFVGMGGLIKSSA